MRYAAMQHIRADRYLGGSSGQVKNDAALQHKNYLGEEVKSVT